MRNAVIASTALLATSALAGTAHVVNSCGYEVHLCNTPAENGGYSQIDKVLQPGDSYSQEYTQLTNGMGWSIKLAKEPKYANNLLQYEYTFHNDGTIWYDLSEVDGNPWSGDWMIDATGNCHPKQQAYRFATDDAYGMQSCIDSVDITVTICSGEDSGSSSPASPSEAGPSDSPAPAPTSYAAPTTTAAPASPAPTSTHGWGHDAVQLNKVNAAADVAGTPTTLVTLTSSAPDGDYDVTVTDVATEVVTAYVTARHQHHRRHAHERRAN